MSLNRKNDYFYNMRVFHNYIKRYLYNKYANNIDNLLEIAIGKGGDLDKWIKNDIKNVIGYDINEYYLKECLRRYNCRNELTPSLSLFLGDLSKDIIQSFPYKFDVISAMFSFHYFFESKQSFNTIMQSILNNCTNDTIFMGTIFDNKQINNIFSQLPFFDENNDIRFDIKKYDSSTNVPAALNKINVYMKNSVLDTPMDEYLIDFDQFVIEMKKYNFILIESNLFEYFYPVFNIKLNNLEQKVSFLYRTFVFKYHLI